MRRKRNRMPDWFPARIDKQCCDGDWYVGEHEQREGKSIEYAVKNAQALLIHHGYACGGRIVAGHENPDGEFGPTTEKAVKDFQTLRKLEADGEIGKDTWTALLTA